MIKAILHVFRRLDDYLQEKLGRPFHAALGVGLVAEIIDRVHALQEIPESSASFTRSVVTVGFCLLLLVHQLAELSERRPQGRRGRPVT